MLPLSLLGHAPWGSSTIFPFLKTAQRNILQVILPSAAVTEFPFQWKVAYLVVDGFVGYGSLWLKINIGSATLLKKEKSRSRHKDSKGKCLKKGKGKKINDHPFHIERKSRLQLSKSCFLIPQIDICNSRFVWFFCSVDDIGLLNEFNWLCLIWVIVILEMVQTNTIRIQEFYPKKTSLRRYCTFKDR